MRHPVCATTFAIVLLLTWYHVPTAAAEATERTRNKKKTAPSKNKPTIPTSQPHAASPSSTPTIIIINPSPSSHEPDSGPSSQPSTASMLPSKIPSSQPSVMPSTIPTHVPSTVPSTYPSALPSKTPSTFPSSSPSFGPTTSQVPSFSPPFIPSNLPSNRPSAFSSESPTNVYSNSPSEYAIPNGQPCDANIPCFSGVCRKGVCYASEECKPIKHKYGTPIDSKTVNLVFVPSGFEMESRDTWKAQVEKTFEPFRNTNMFSSSNAHFNAFYVDATSQPSFCWFHCHNIPRLMCCDLAIGHDVAGKCVAAGATRQVIVIHNDAQYGGAGYNNAQMATASTHPWAKHIALHEIGHSLFNFGDEYNGNARDNYANCDVAGCPKWSDLIGNKKVASVYGTVSCSLGHCHQGQYYTGQESFMNGLGQPIGAVNERYTCCTFLALTGAMPSYCNTFDFTRNYLVNYCRTKNFQNYDIPDSGDIRVRRMNTKKNISHHHDYVFVENPQLITIILGKGAENNTFISDENLDIDEGREGGMYPIHWVDGDFATIEDARNMGSHHIWRVIVQTSNGHKYLRYHGDRTEVHVPPTPGKNEISTGETRASVKVQLLELVIERDGSAIEYVEADLLQL